MIASTLAFAVSSCGGDARSNEAVPPRDEPGAWEKLPAPPLSGRVQALVASVGDTIIAAGGWDWLCPPNANCRESTTPPFKDGAAYDLGTGQWRPIAEAPLGLRATVSAVVGAEIYALSQCSSGPTCPAGRALLRYRSDADEWDVLPAPDAMDTGSYGVAAVSDGVVAYSQSDEQGQRADFRFSASDDGWTTLPNDPLPAVYDRFVVEYAGRLLLFGTALTDGETNTKLVAAYDPASEGWQALAESETLGFQVWRAGSLFYLNPHFRNAGGGIYDPDANQWRSLRDLPHHDMAGIISDTEASYADGYTSGWVLDTRSDRWLEIEQRPDSSAVYDAVTAVAPGKSLVVFGGQTWTSSEGTLLNDTWLWRPTAR